MIYDQDFNIKTCKRFRIVIKEVLWRAAGCVLVTELQNLINISRGHHLSKPGAGKLKKYLLLKQNIQCLDLYKRRWMTLSLAWNFSPPISRITHSTLMILSHRLLRCCKIHLKIFEGAHFSLFVDLQTNCFITFPPENVEIWWNKI